MTAMIIKGGDILDIEEGKIIHGQDLYIRDDRIVAGLSQEETCSAAVLDVKGKTVMPGLIDCHVHIVASIANLGKNARLSNVWATIRAIPILQGMLDRGFTSVRDAGGADWALMQAVESDMIAGPRIFPSGKALSQTGGHGDFRPRGDDLDCLCQLRTGAIGRVVDGVDAVRLAAREEIQKGATQIKIMASGGVASPTDPIHNTQYSEDEIRAVVAEAVAANTYVMAHAYTGRAIARAVKCGVRTVEHANLVDDAAAKCMADHGAFAVPTLITYDATVQYGAKYGVPPEALVKVRETQVAGKQSLEIFSKYGVAMGYGSDLLGEMHELQNGEFAIRAAVLGNLEAIRSATTVAADIIQKRGELGTLRNGAIADILIVKGDPLKDIRVLSQAAGTVEWVIQNGKVRKSPNTAATV